MKKQIAFGLLVMFIFYACQKEDPIPNVRISTFNIKELPGTEFLPEESGEPLMIVNTLILPSGTNLGSLTPVFTLSGEGSLWAGGLQIESGVTKIDFTDPVLLKTIGYNGEIDLIYQVDIQVTEPEAPKIEQLDFTLDPYSRTPLAGLLELELDRECLLEVNTRGQDNNDLIKKYDVPSSSFSVPVLGLYAGTTNQVVITVTDPAGLKSQEALFITTAPLPQIYPGAEVLVSEPDEMEPGMILVYLKKYINGLTNGTKPLACIIDPYGKVRWIYLDDFSTSFQRLQNGNWLIGSPEGAFEMDMLGNRTGNRWDIPHVHHDIVELPNGDFLALSEHDDSVEDVVLEISRQDSRIIKEWDFKSILDPSRPMAPYHPNPNDWLHLNGMDYDPVDDAIIVSGRNQSAVVKIDRQSGEIIWILGNHENWPEEYQKYLLTPVGENFEWQWGQHAPMLHPDDHSRIILFDNGNERSYENPLPAMENYSRGVEYRVDEERMEVYQLWQYGKQRGRELFCPYICDADYLIRTDNRLMSFGGITRNLNGNSSEIFNEETGSIIPVKNYTHIIESDINGKVVFEVIFADKSLSFAGFRSYRAHKLSIYPIQQ